jgi:hypothetical protein
MNPIFMSSFLTHATLRPSRGGVVLRYTTQDLFQFRNAFHESVMLLNITSNGRALPADNRGILPNDSQLSGHRRQVAPELPAAMVPTEHSVRIDLQ